MCLHPDLQAINNVLTKGLPSCPATDSSIHALSTICFARCGGFLNNLVSIRMKPTFIDTLKFACESEIICFDLIYPLQYA
jgi:hypothetical protein